MSDSGGHAAIHGSRPAALLFRLLLILAVLTACASFTWPFGWDQGIFAWIGDVIIRGGLPYRDGWDIKGPLPYYVYAGAEWLLGRHGWSIRVVDIVFMLAASLVLFRMLHTWCNRSIAAWATLLFTLWYASGSYWNTAQPDGWVMMLMIPVAAMLLRPQRQAGWIEWWLAGMLIGCAVLAKFFYAGFLLVPAMVALADRPRPAALIIRAAACLTGFLLPLLVTVWWFWWQDALDTFIEVTLRYPADTYRLLVQSGIESRLRGLFEYLTGGTGVAAALPLVVFGLYAGWRRSPALAMGLASWMLVAIAAVVMQNRFFIYHWLPLVPALVISAAIGVHALFDEPRAAAGLPGNRASMRAMFAGFLMLVFVLHVAALPAFEVLHWGSYLSGRSSADEYHRHFGSPADDIAMARLVGEVTDEDDSVVIFGWNSSILFLSGRQSPTRFGFSMPLMQGNEGSRWFVEYRDEFMQVLRRERPAAIVAGTQSEQLLGGKLTLADFPALGDYVAEHYDEGRKVGTLTLYLDRERIR